MAREGDGVEDRREVAARSDAVEGQRNAATDDLSRDERKLVARHLSVFFFFICARAVSLDAR